MEGHQDDALRSQLVRRSSRAARAQRASGVNPNLIPPPMFGGPVVQDFGSIAFAHETPTYGSASDPFMTAHMLLDVMAQGIGALEDQLEQARKKPERAPSPALARRAEPARREGTPWHHNPWIVGTGSAVIAGAILALIFGTS
jgi:hypothetical protein